MIKQAERLFHTLRYLKLKQFIYFFIHRFLPTASVTYHGSPEPDQQCELAGPLVVNGITCGTNGFCFLNEKLDFEDAVIDWCPSSMSRLWRYNLHYFDCLREPARSSLSNIEMILNWIKNNPQGSQPGWEPFTASLRIVNWIFYLNSNPGAQQPEIIKSLYTQVLWLEKNDERHILANHYVENLKALVFAGAFFGGNDASRWLKKGIVGLQQQLQEQTLADGGHYERTPQYHGLMLENYLDIYNLASNNPGVFSELFLVQFSRQCLAGLVFYQSITFPDNRLPLFNDTAFGIAPGLAELDNYWQRLSGQSSALHAELESIISLPESGLFVYRSNIDMLIIDAGDIGPSYQPGHTHCDMLSYELMLSGQRVIVDSGVYEYEPGEMRTYVRSTRAHNTVSIDGVDQSEVWGEFRVARRAKIISANIEKMGNAVIFDGAYQGFHRVGRNTLHARRVTIELDDDEGIELVQVTEQVKGIGVHGVESFIHIHPDVKLSDNGEGLVALSWGGSLQAEIIIESGVDYFFEQAFYCPEFGLKQANSRIVLEKTQEFPCELSYMIRKI